MKTPRTRGKSSSLEILGNTPKKPRNQWSEQLRRLTELREQFLRGRNAQTISAKEELTWFSEHMADAATDSYDRDCALALLSSTQNAIYEIDQALQRINAGTYGTCELTGEPIERERLNAIPWTRFSLAAQAKLEARRGMPKVQLGKLGTLAVGGSDEGDDDDSDDVSSNEREREAA